MNVSQGASETQSVCFDAVGSVHDLQDESKGQTEKVMVEGFAQVTNFDDGIIYGWFPPRINKRDEYFHEAQERGERGIATTGVMDIVAQGKLHGFGA
jgi:hypothetical protein